jgi:hypothetical protein
MEHLEAPLSIAFQLHGIHGSARLSGGCTNSLGWAGVVLEKVRADKALSEKAAPFAKSLRTGCRRDIERRFMRKVTVGAEAATPWAPQK